MICEISPAYQSAPSYAAIEEQLLTACHTQSDLIPEVRGLLRVLQDISMPTYHHCVRAASIARTLAQAHGCSQEDTDTLTLATLLHDYGKVFHLNEFSDYDTLSPKQQHALRVAHVQDGYTAVLEYVGERIARIMVTHHEFPQPSCESYPRDKTQPEVWLENNHREPPSEAHETQQALCALADQLDAMTDSDRIRNNGLQLVQTESEILKHIQSAPYWPESIRPNLEPLVHEAIQTLKETYGTNIC